MARAKVSEGVFFIDRARHASLQAQVRETVVAGILSRQFPFGARLPSTRLLARHLGVARVTVTTAFQELVAQGYLRSSDRSAYVVADTAPVSRMRAGADRADAPGVDWSAKIPRSLEGLRRVKKAYDWRQYPFPFIYGQMDMSLFDLGAWRDCARQAMGRQAFEDMAGDVAAADDPMLVNYICTRTLPRRGISAEPDQVLVTVGAQNALWLTIQLLVRDDFHAVVENPGHPDIASALRWLGAHVTAIDVDGEGLPTDALPDDADAIFVTPSHHAPTAVTMPMPRRQALLGAAAERDLLIVEDDYDFETSFLSAPSPALKSLDRSDRVIYVGSFSKSLFPGLRLGYMVAAAPFIREARFLRALMFRHPPGHQQRTTGYFLALGYYDQMIRRQRLAFAERREIAVEALYREGLELRGAAAFGGTNLWVGGPEDLDSMALAEALQQDGVLIEPGAPFYEKPDGPVRFFRLGYASIPLERIDEGIRRIGQRLRKLA